MGKTLDSDLPGRLQILTKKKVYDRGLRKKYFLNIQDKVVSDFKKESLTFKKKKKNIINV